MKIADESETVRTMAEKAFSGPVAERADALGQLREFSPSAAHAGEAELAHLGNPVRAIQSSVDTYRQDRQTLIDYRLRNGLPVEVEG
jgi:hypothetical protein